MASLGPIGAGLAVAIALFSWGWTRAARFRSERGKAPWSIPPAGWGAMYLVVPIGWILYSAATRTTKVVDPSLAYKADTVIADSAEERERLQRIASELPLLRPPQPQTRGWHVDPARQRRFRYYDGQRWTREVTDDPALRITAAVGDPKEDLKRRLRALPPPREAEASWHIDPLGTYHFRYFDGEEWTEEVHKVRRSS